MTDLSTRLDRLSGEWEKTREYETAPIFLPPPSFLEGQWFIRKQEADAALAELLTAVEEREIMLRLAVAEAFDWADASDIPFRGEVEYLADLRLRARQPETGGTR